MNARKLIAPAVSFAAVGALVLGAWGVASTVGSIPTPAAPAPRVAVVGDFATPIPTATPSATPTATATIEPEPAPAPAPVEEVAPVTEEQAPVEEYVEPAPVEVQPEAPVYVEPAPAPAPPAPAAPPIRCPAGSSSLAFDGYNDTSCMPDECFSVAIPDAAYPQCDAPFRP